MLYGLYQAAVLQALFSGNGRGWGGPAVTSGYRRPSGRGEEIPGTRLRNSSG